MNKWRPDEADRVDRPSMQLQITIVQESAVQLGRAGGMLPRRAQTVEERTKRTSAVLADASVFDLQARQEIAQNLIFTIPVVWVAWSAKKGRQFMLADIEVSQR